MYVYTWKLNFVENDDDSDGECFAVALSKEEAIKKLVDSYKTEHEGEHNLDGNCEVLQYALTNHEPSIIQVEKFVYPPGGYYNPGVRFYGMNYYV